MDEDARKRPQMLPGFSQIPLSMREHQALRQLAACLSGITISEPIIEKRMRMFKYGRLRYGVLKSAMYFVYDALIDTIPTNKLTQTRLELENTRYDLYTDFIKSTECERGYVCVKESTLIKLAMLLQEQSCYLCDKRGKDVKKCKARKAFLESINFDVPFNESGDCFFALNSIDDISGKFFETGGE